MNRFFFFLLAIILAGCRQDDTKINFEKITFHTSDCYGNCPTYHLEINKDKTARLYAEHVFLDQEVWCQPDSSKEGYFKGSVDDTTFNKLVSQLGKIGLDTLEFDNAQCCDGSITTIIIYYNGKRKFFRSMFPPPQAHELISLLYKICEAGSLERTNEKFTIEQAEK